MKGRMRAAIWLVVALAVPAAGTKAEAAGPEAAAGTEAMASATGTGTGVVAEAGAEAMAGLSAGAPAAQGGAADRGTPPEGAASPLGAAARRTRLASDGATPPESAAPHPAATDASGGALTGAAAPAAALPTAPPDLPAFLRQADAWLLSGRDLPPELPRLLVRLGPADRLTAIAYLRRLGLLDGAAMPLEEVLAPPEEPGA